MRISHSHNLTFSHSHILTISRSHILTLPLCSNIPSHGRFPGNNLIFSPKTARNLTFSHSHSTRTHQAMGDFRGTNLMFRSLGISHSHKLCKSNIRFPGVLQQLEQLKHLRLLVFVCTIFYYTLFYCK